MLNIFAKSSGRFCDGVSRRDFLRIGSLAAGGAIGAALGQGGLSLPTVLRAQSQAAAKPGRSGSSSSHKAVIMILLGGGPSHQDMYDIKTEAPSEIRGEFRPIRTKVPGVQICEHLPRIAATADRFAFIRSVVGSGGDHALDQCTTGFTSRVALQQNRPGVGAVLSKLRGPVDPSVPSFVGLSPRTGEVRWSNPGAPGFLGVAHSAFTPFVGGAAGDDMTLQGITADRLGDRTALLAAFDRFRRDVDRLDSTGQMGGLDVFQRQALGVLTSGKLVDALDLSKEDPKNRERYGYGDMKLMDDGGPACMDQLVLARRLVEAGARCVSLTFGRWDTHGNNFKTMREILLPRLDQGVSALVADLHERGLGDDVTVLVWGEFGRTPKINKDAGRDHWPNVSCALLAGGGLRTGQAIGSTTRDGGSALDRPVTHEEVLATVYHALGIDLNATIPDRTGRPMYLLENREVMKELV